MKLNAKSFSVKNYRNIYGISLVIVEYSEFELKGKRLLRADSDKAVIERRFHQWK